MSLPLARPPAARPRARRPRLDVARLTLLAIPLFVVASWAYIVTRQAGGGLDELVSQQTWDELSLLLRRLLGLEGAAGLRPAYLEPARWAEIACLAYETLAMSVLAIGISTLGMLATVVPGAHGRTDEGAADTGGTSRALRRAGFALVRTIWIVTRAVPELVWALLIVFVFQQGKLAGAIALGVHNFGILGRLCAEVVEDPDHRPARALRAAAAGRPQLLFYGLLPQVLLQFLTYIPYRWEVVIRATIIVGFVSAGGLGREFRLAMSFFHWTDVALILAVYFLLVLAVDAASAALRRLAR